MAFDGQNHMTTGPSLSNEIRSEADRILGSGLLALLVKYGLNPGMPSNKQIDPDAR